MAENTFETSNTQSPPSSSTSISSESSAQSLEWDLTYLQITENENVNPEQLSKIDKWINYHQNRLSYYTELKRHYIKGGNLRALGYQTQKSAKLPKKPVTVIFTEEESKDQLLKPKELTQLKGIELLQELKKYIRPEATQDGTVCKFNPDESDITIVEKNILEGDQFISRKKKLLLSDTVALGLWLEKRFELSEDSFSKFVEHSCSFQKDWAYKIRKLGTVFAKYKRLQSLDLSITTAIKLCRKIDLALSANPSYQEFWNCDGNLPTERSISPSY